MAIVDLSTITIQKRSNNFKDLTGQRFGRLLALSYFKTPQKRGCTWNCLCDCGNTHQAQGGDLRIGDTLSCGCLGKERRIASTKKHGLSNTRVFKIWAGIKSRCYNSNDTCYHNYGGRGIFMFEDWRNDFQSFYSYVGDAPSSFYSIDRIDNNRGYEPGNVRWVTLETQARNKRTNVYFSLKGKTQTLIGWSKELSVDRHTLSRRKKKGWCDICVLTVDFKKNGPSRKHICAHQN